MTKTITLTGGSVNAHQIFFVQLGDNFLEFRLNFVTRYSTWSLDVLREGVSLISGAMLAPGAEITKGYNANMGRLLFVGDETTIDNLGIANKLVWEDVGIL